MQKEKNLDPVVDLLDQAIKKLRALLPISSNEIEIKK